MRKTYIVLIAFGIALVGAILSGIAYSSVKPPLGEIMFVAGVAMMVGGSVIIGVVLLVALIKMIFS